MRTTILFLLTFMMYQCNTSKSTTQIDQSHAETKINTLPPWTIYAIGKPYKPYWDAREAIAKKWKIPLIIVFGGCVITEETDKKAKEIEEGNKIAFEVYAEKFGADWLERFNAEADALLAKSKL